MTPKPPPAIRQAEQPPQTPEQEKLEQEKRQLRQAYVGLFATENGKLVLADLKKRYGWDGEVERPSYKPGMDHAMTASADSMKEPVRHIISMATLPPEKPQPKPSTATN